MTYSYLKIIHLLAVMLFLGNIITGLFWMRLAVKTGHIGTMNFAMKGIRKADQYFTIPGVIVITAFGFLAAIIGKYPILGTGWIFWSIIMFSISGIIFSVWIIPLQKKIYHLTLGKESLTDFEWRRFKNWYKQWDFWGLLAILTPMAAFVMMILKVPK